MSPEQTRQAGCEHADRPRDGKWLVLQGRGVNESRDVFAVQIGVDTGTRSPVWSKDGRELFYIDDVRRQLVAVPITTSPEFAAGVPRALFSLPNDAYLIHFITDGQRFLFARRSPALSPRHRPLLVTENWTRSQFS